MDSLAPDFQTARTMMVDSQVRPNKVNDRRIIEAMRRLPRERFLPASQAALAYADEDVPLGQGRCMVEPMVVARMVQLAAVQPGERVLVVAAGTGYAAALLAELGAQVTALEDDTALLAIARPALAALAPTVQVVEGALAAGWPASGGYDVVFIDGAAEEIPAAIAAQVKRQGGRFVGIDASSGVSQAVSGAPSGEGLALRPAFDCATARLPAFRRKASFVF